MKIDCLTFSISSTSFSNVILTSDNCSFVQLFSVEEVFLGRQLACAERQEQQQAGGGVREDVQQGLHAACTMTAGTHGQDCCWGLCKQPS